MVRQILERPGRSVGYVLAAVTAISLSAGASAQTASKTPYVVGSSNQLTGTTAALSRPFVAGATTYFKLRNDNGGANGHPIQLNVLDDQGNPDMGVANTKKLLSDGSLVLLGPVSSAVGIPMLPVINEAKVPMVSYTGVEQMESDPYYYAVGLDGTRSFEIVAAYLKTKVSGTAKVAFFTVDSPALSAARDATSKLIQGWGWQVVDTESYSIKSTEFNAQALKLAAAKPDFIIGALDDGKAPIALPTLQRAGVKAPLINFPSGNAESAFKAIASEQFLAVREYLDSSDPDPATKPMRDAAAKYGTTASMSGGAFTKGWIAAQIMAAALDTCADSCTGEKAKAALDAMSSFDTKGLGPTVSFSPTKKLGVTSGRIYQWSAKDGRAVAITPLVEAAH